MSEEKKAGSQGPVVIRKGHVKPPPPARRSSRRRWRCSRLRREKRAKEDPRPLWQRLAEEKAGARPRRAPRPRAPRPPRARPAPRTAAAATRPRDARRAAGASAPTARAARSAAPTAGPKLPPGEPPPAPEADAPDEGSFADMLAAAGGAPRAAPQGRRQGRRQDHPARPGRRLPRARLGRRRGDDRGRRADGRGRQRRPPASGDIVDGVVVQSGDRGVVDLEGARPHLARPRARGGDRGGAHRAAGRGRREGGEQGRPRGRGPRRARLLPGLADRRPLRRRPHLVRRPEAARSGCRRPTSATSVLSRRALLEEERADEGEGDPREARAGRGARRRRDERAGLRRVRRPRRRRGARARLRAVVGSRVEAAGPAQARRRGAGAGAEARAGPEEGRADQPLGPRPHAEARAEGRARGAAARGTAPAAEGRATWSTASVDKIESFGVFVRFAGGRGLVPASETGTPRGSDLRRAFKVGRHVPGARPRHRRAAPDPALEDRRRGRGGAQGGGRVHAVAPRGAPARASARSATCCGRSSRRSDGRRAGGAPRSGARSDGPRTSRERRSAQGASPSAGSRAIACGGSPRRRRSRPSAFSSISSPQGPRPPAGPRAEVRAHDEAGPDERERRALAPHLRPARRDRGAVPPPQRRAAAGSARGARRAARRAGARASSGGRSAAPAGRARRPRPAR